MIKKLAWTVAVVFLGFFHLGMQGHDDDYLHSKWFALLCLAGVAIAINLGQKFSLAAGAAFAYTVFSGLYPFINWQGLAFFIPLCWAISECDDFSMLRFAFGIACFADSLWVIGQAISTHFYHFHIGGFLDYGSINGCFIAVTLPFFMEFEIPELLVFPFTGLLLTCILDGAMNTLGVSAIVLLIVGLRASSVGGMLVIGWVCALFGFFLYALFDFGLLHSSGRFEMYQATWNFFHAAPPIRQLFGFGMGSFSRASDFLSAPLHQSGSWLFLHCDYLQTLFEQGIIGFCIYVWLLIDCLRRIWDDRFLLASFLGLCGTMLFQYPLRLSLFALFGLALVGMSLGKRIGKPNSGN